MAEACNRATSPTRSPAHDITLLIGCSDYDPKQAATEIRAMLARGVDALAILGEVAEPGLLDLIRSRRVPYLLTYGFTPNSIHPSVGFDNRAAFHVITRHLLALGHTAIGLILQPTVNNERVTARLAGMRDALAEDGLGLRLNICVRVNMELLRDGEDLGRCSPILSGSQPR